MLLLAASLIRMAKTYLAHQARIPDSERALVHRRHVAIGLRTREAQVAFGWVHRHAAILADRRYSDSSLLFAGGVLSVLSMDAVRVGDRNTDCNAERHKQ